METKRLPLPESQASGLARGSRGQQSAERPSFILGAGHPAPPAGLTGCHGVRRGKPWLSLFMLVRYVRVFSSPRWKMENVNRSVRCRVCLP